MHLLTLIAATPALTTLVQSGPNCRSQLTTGKAPEPAIRRSLLAFHKWALRDGRLKHKTFPPLIATVIARPSEDGNQVFARATKRLQRNGRQWSRWFRGLQEEQHEMQILGRVRGRKRHRTESADDVEYEEDQYRPVGQGTKKKPRHHRNQKHQKLTNLPATGELPLLYAFIVKSSLLAIVTWDPNPRTEDTTQADKTTSPAPSDLSTNKLSKRRTNQKDPSETHKPCAPSSPSIDRADSRPVRMLGTYDWALIGQDVWHALAVAIVECKARNDLMRMDENGWLRDEREEDVHGNKRAKDDMDL